MTDQKDTDADPLREARDFLESTGKADLADRLDGKLEDHRETVQTIVEMRNAITQAEEAGLGDDPAVQQLREEAEALAEEAGLAPDPDPATQLAADHDLNPDAVDRLHEDDREALLEHLEAVDEIGTTTRTEGATLARHELQSRRKKIESLLDHNNVRAAELVAEDASEKRADLQAALAGDHSPAVDETASDRVKRATLADERDALQERIKDTESPLLRLELQEELEDIEDRLADLEAGA